MTTVFGLACKVIATPSDTKVNLSPIPDKVFLPQKHLSLLGNLENFA
jgi:hypothetical protein